MSEYKLMRFRMPIDLSIHAYTCMDTRQQVLVPYSFFINEYASSRKHVLERAERVYAGTDVGDATFSSGDPEGRRIDRQAQGLPEKGVLLCNFNQVL